MQRLTGDLEMTDDSELCRGVAGESLACFDELYRRHSKAVYGFCLMKTGGSDASDALQETFVALWRGAKTFRAQTSFKSWLFGIAQHKCADIHRRRYRSPDSFEDTDWHEPSAPFPAESVEIRDALASLTPEAKEAIFLVYYQGLSYEETAVILGIPIGTVKSRLFHGKAALSREVEKSGRI